MRNVLELSPLEVASGYLFGEQRDAPELPSATQGATLRQELERSVRGALERSPCVVAFSGGRDSAAVLALAVNVARREQLPPPIPVTYRFAAAESDESNWQEQVVAHLGIEDWVRQEFGDELDLLGPVARDGLRRHGLLWPLNAHFHRPMQEVAGHGSVLTGLGGDHILHPGRHARLAGVLKGRERPVPRDGARLLLAAAPAPFREARRRREPHQIDCPWLRPAAADELVRAFARENAQEPVRRRRWVRWMWRLRETQVNLRSLDLIAADTGTLLVHPLLDPAVLASFGETAHRRTFQNRTAAMRELFGDLLPRAVCERRTKASFNTAFWSRYAREFALSLSEEEVDSEMVDGEQALAYWRGPEAETGSAYGSGNLLQACWLAREERSAAERGEQRLPGGVEGVPVARTL